MKNFICSCGQLLFFENSQCTRCGKTVAYDPVLARMQSLQPLGNDWIAESGKSYRLCKNSIEFGVCNWLIDTDSTDNYCIACGLNEVIPSLLVPENRQRWSDLETAKRRLIYTLLQLRLPVVSRRRNPASGLAFAFLQDRRSNAHVTEEFVSTGHARGLITVNLMEADDVSREQQRQTLGELYRTLLGHFRHESGHYYFDMLLRNNPRIEQFRSLFGDERSDYNAALQRYYDGQCAPDAGRRFISAYARSHPLEDWAETWSHYLHMIDTLETAAAHDLTDRDALNGDFDQRITAWMKLSIALNNLNRGAGLQDPYPFVLSTDVIGKLGFIDATIASAPATTM